MASEDFEGVEIHADDEVLRRDGDSFVLDDEPAALPEDEASEAPAAPAATTSTSSKTKRYLALAAAGAALLGIVIGVGAGLGTQKNDRAVSASHITGVTLADCLDEAEMATSAKSSKSTSGGGKSGKGTSMSYASKSSKSGSDPDPEDIPSLVELSPTMAPTEQGTTTVAKEAFSDPVRKRELRGGDRRMWSTQRIGESVGEQIERTLNEDYYYPTCKEALEDYYGSKGEFAALDGNNGSKSSKSGAVASKSSKAGGGSKSSKSPTGNPAGSPTESPSTCTDRTLVCGDVVTCSTVGLPSVGGDRCGTSPASGGAASYQIVGTGGFIGLHTCGGSTNFDTQIRVYDDNGDCVAGNNNGGCDGPGTLLASAVDFQSVAGVVYDILVDGNGSAEGTFTLTVGCGIPGDQECPACLVPIPRDDCPDNPAILPGCKDAFLEVGDLCEGDGGECETKDGLNNCGNVFDVYRKLAADDPRCRPLICGEVFTSSNEGLPSVAAGVCGDAVDGSRGAVWYQIVGTGGFIGLYTCGGSTNFDTQIRVYRDGKSTCVAGNNDSCDGGASDPGTFLASAVDFESVAGVVYDVLVDGFEGAEGNFTLTVRCSDQECPDCLVPIDSRDCPSNPISLPNCKDYFVGVGELCEADGECGTNAALDNCQSFFDVYNKTAADDPCPVPIAPIAEGTGGAETSFEPEPDKEGEPKLPSNE